MYKAVLVDDENFDLLGLQQLIPWQALGIEIVFSTNKPLAVVDYIRSHPIDILISDIKMPVMSGLELAQLTLQLHPATKIVFISGYQDFEYAKQALKLKADGYILKPVDDDEIVATLRAVVEGLDSRPPNEQSEPLEDFEFIRNDFLIHLLEGTIDDVTLTAFLRKYPIEISFDCAHAVIVEIDGTSGKKGDRLSSDVLDHLYQHMKHYAATLSLGLLCKIPPNRVALVYTGETVQIEEVLNHLLDEIRTASAYTVTIAYGQAAEPIASLPNSFREAKELIACKMFLGKNRVIAPQASQQRIVKGTQDINANLDQLFTGISEYNLVMICDLIEELFEHVKGYTEPVKVYHFSTHLISRMESYLATTGESMSSLESWKDGGFADIEQFETVDDIKSWLRKTAFELSEILFMKKQKPSWKLLPEIECYVRTHLSGEITIKNAASRFAYSPNHFGVLFKEQVGMSFNDFVVRERMERARHLLASPHLKVYEIAEEVGYNSLTYFSRTFKEQFGTTPGDYRKQG